MLSLTQRVKRDIQIDLVTVFETVGDRLCNTADADGHAIHNLFLNPLAPEKRTIRSGG